MHYSNNITIHRNNIPPYFLLLVPIQQNPLCLIRFHNSKYNTMRMWSCTLILSPVVSCGALQRTTLLRCERRLFHTGHRYVVGMNIRNRAHTRIPTNSWTLPHALGVLTKRSACITILAIIHKKLQWSQWLRNIRYTRWTKFLWRHS